MTHPQARGYLLDTSVLAALPFSRQVSTLITAGPRMRVPLYAPVTCLDAADRLQPGVARHIARIPAIEPVDLTYGAVLDIRENTPGVPLDIAHVISLGRPHPGLMVATILPNLYDGYELRIYELGD